MHFHYYADDIQLYLYVKPETQTNLFNYRQVLKT